MKAGLELVGSLLSPAHTTHRVGTQPMFTKYKIKRGQEVIVTETYLTKGLFLGTQLVEVMCTTHSGF